MGPDRCANITAARRFFTTTTAISSFSGHLVNYIKRITFVINAGHNLLRWPFPATV
jgi:hypothetical protein